MLHVARSPRGRWLFHILHCLRRCHVQQEGPGGKYIILAWGCKALLAAYDTKFHHLRQWRIARHMEEPPPTWTSSCCIWHTFSLSKTMKNCMAYGRAISSKKMKNMEKPPPTGLGQLPSLLIVNNDMHSHCLRQWRFARHTEEPPPTQTMRVHVICSKKKSRWEVALPYAVQIFIVLDNGNACHYLL